MCSRAAAALSVLTLLGGVIACDEAAVAPPSDTSSPPADTTTCEPASCAAVEGAPSFQIGTNEAGVVDVVAFQEAVDQSEVPVVLGGQGAWMVVLAVATNQLDCCVDRINIRAQLALPDGSDVLGMINYRRRPLLDGEDGMRYLLNTWMVLGDETKWNGKSAVLTLSVEPYGGGPILEKSVTVTLRKDTSQGLEGTDSALRVGTHLPQARDPSSFKEVNDGDELYGTPTSDATASLVLGAATRALDAAANTVDVTIEVSPTSGAEPIAILTLADRAVVRDRAGDAYVLGLEVPLGPESSWLDVPVSLTVGVQASGRSGPVSQKTLIVTLRKQAVQ